MNKEIIYKESVRQYEEGNNADNVINKKVDFLLVLSTLFIGYFFTVENFIDIFIKGNVLVKHIFGAGFLFLIISLIFTIRAFLLMRFKRGLKIDSIERISKKHDRLNELSIINFSLKNAIKYNYEKQKKKNRYFFKGFVFLSLSILLFIISKIIFLY